MGTSMFEGIRTAEISNRDLANTMNRVRRLTAGGYSSYEQNEEALSKLLSRIMKLSHEEKEWYVYFDALYYRIYLASRSGDSRTIVRYAEVYYRDSALYMDRALPDYPGTDMAKLNVWICIYIRNAYESYCEIDDQKMDAFMKLFEETVHKYGQRFWYYRGEMMLAILYRDKALMEHGRKQFEKYEKEMDSCYICGHIECLAYEIMMDRLERAEELLLAYRDRRIPKRHQWCYRYCQRAEAQSLYADALEYSLDLGKPEAFRYFYEKYWLTLPRDCQRGERERWYCNLSIYACAIAGNFDALETDCAEAQEDIDRMETYSAVARIKAALKWRCYFALLDRSGVHEVKIRLPEGHNAGQEAMADAADAVPTLEVSRYMERIADENGEKFSKARAKYDYGLTRASYLECAGLLNF
ncbi:MAG: hypothetical protein NC331_13130 [Lachnospiraceae bacterium]|nr:hypothetical protein [Lachnospiraceae bacterium]MCM1240308.1 hypothetical protein [Lachnospiraceae bacterium]